MPNAESHHPIWLRRFFLFWRAILWVSLAVSIYESIAIDPALLGSWRGAAFLLVVAGFLLCYELFERSDVRRGMRWPLPYWQALLYLIYQLACVEILLHYSPSFLGALLALMGQVFSALPRRKWLVPIGAIAVVASVPMGLADSLLAGDLSGLIGFGFFMATWVALAIFIGALFHERHQRECLIDELKQAKDDLERYALQSQELAALRERARLGREMHDSLGHALVVVNVKLEAAQRLYAVDARRGDAELEQTRELVRSTMGELRRSLANLRAELPHHQDLPQALRQIADDVRARTRLAICCAAPADLAPLPPEISEALWRVAREALMNIERHAGASRADVALECHADGVVLRVSDNGAGVDAAGLARRGHYGVTGMRERVEALGGSFRIAAQPGGGTLVEARVPVGEP